MQSGDTKIKQQQIQDLLFNREIGWQDIIYDLINSEQLDPWDVNIKVLTEKYLLKVQELEEADFFISSKVLLAASFLLKIKSEILLNKYIRSIDEILMGKKESVSSKLERIELDEAIPDLIPRSPMPRYKKVTLKELMDSLNKVVNTENRRIRKEVIKKNALRESSIPLPKKRISLKDKVTIIFTKIKDGLKEKKAVPKVNYFEIIEKKERASSFVPLLHLEQQSKIWLEQKDHFKEIFIWEKKTFIKINGEPYAELRENL